MGRGGCNCCGDWCTTARVNTDGGELVWNYNYGDDTFNIGQINKSVYTNGSSFLNYWTYNYDGTARKTPFGSSHVYEVVHQANDSFNSPNSLYMKRVDEKGKFVSAKNVFLAYLYYYPYYWYGWTPYTTNLLKFNSTDDHLFIRGSANLSFVEDMDSAKAVFQPIEVNGQTQIVSNYNLAWDLLPKYMYSSYNTIWGWAGWWNGYGPQAYGFGMNGYKNSVYVDDTVIFGSESSYYSYYNASGFSNMVISYQGVTEDRVLFKAIGNLNMVPYTQSSSMNINNGHEAINIQNVYNGDAVLNIFPTAGGQIHTYDVIELDNGFDYSNAKPLASVDSEGSITTYFEDLVDGLANSYWADVSFDSCLLFEGAFELYFSLPRNDYDMDGYSGPQINPETWPSLLQQMSFGINFSYSTYWQDVDSAGDINDEFGISYVNAIFTQSLTGFDSTIWEYPVGYYFSPITVSIPMLFGNLTDISYYYAYNTAFVQLNQDEILYFNRDFTTFAIDNIGFELTNPNDIGSIPIYEEIDVSDLDSYYADPADFLGIDTSSVLGVDISFNFNGLPYNVAPYIFNRVGIDDDLYTVLTLFYSLYEIKYSISATVTIVPSDDGSDATAIIQGAATPTSVNPRLSNSSFMINLNEDFFIKNGVLLDQTASDILKYDITNYDALVNGYGPYIWDNNYAFNFLINNGAFPWANVYYGYGYAYGASVQNIERSDGQLHIGVSEQFNKFTLDSNQLAVLNDANYYGVVVPIVGSINYALFRNQNLIVLDETGELANLLKQTVNGSPVLMYNSNPNQSILKCLEKSSANVITINADGSIAGTNFIPHLSTMSSDNKGNVIVGAINSSNRVLMSTGVTYLLGEGGIDFTQAIQNAGTNDQDTIDAIWSFSGSKFMYPAECIYLTPDFNDATIDLAHSQDMVLQMNGDDIVIPLKSTAKQITAIFNEAGYDVTVVGGPIYECAIMITGINSFEFDTLIDGFDVNDSLAKYRAGTGFWPIYGDAIQYSYYNPYLRPEQFSSDYGDVLWDFGNAGSLVNGFFNSYGWWGYGLFAGFFNVNIYNNLLLAYAQENGWAVEVFEDGTWEVIDPRGIQGLSDAFYNDNVKVAAPLTEQMGYIAPYMEFASPSKDRISFTTFMSIDDLTQRMICPEMLDLDIIEGVGSNASSVFHSGFAAKMMNSVSTLKSNPAGLYQIRGDAKIEWATPIGFKSMETKVDGITYEESPAFCGRVNDMIVNTGGNCYISTNMINLGESKPSAYSSYSEYYNNEILNRIDVRKATKSQADPNCDASGMAPDGNGGLELVPVPSRNTVIFDSLASIDALVSPKQRYRTTYEIPKILRNS